jgi:methanogenic corrinoid protein MtbC1
MMVTPATQIVNQILNTLRTSLTVAPAGQVHRIGNSVVRMLSEGGLNFHVLLGRDVKEP